MMNKSTAARTYGVILATVFAIVVAFAAYRLFPGMNPEATVPIFIVFWAGFFLTGSRTPLIQNSPLPKVG